MTVTSCKLTCLFISQLVVLSRSTSVIAIEDHHMWKNGTVDDVWDHLDCGGPVLNREDITLYGSESWSAIHRMVQESAIYIDDSEDAKDDSSGDGEYHTWRNDGFQVPHETKFNEYGRGVYATEVIPEGSLIYKCKNTICLDDPDKVRRLLKNLPTKIACEVLHWGYTFDSKASMHGTTFCLEVDNGALFNDARIESEMNTKETIFEMDENDSSKLYCEYRALRTIQAGEELLISYNAFTSDSYGSMGL